MDFAEWKRKNSQFPKADSHNPWMGLDGKICEKPIYWCRMHEVWLSEDDVTRKNCFARLSADMLIQRRCNCLERKEKNPFIWRNDIYEV